MKTKLVFSLCVLVLGAKGSFAEETDPNVIFKKAQATYDALDSYNSQGTVIADVRMNDQATKVETAFSVKLKKPNLYLITWEQKQPMMPGFSQAGAVWSNGVDRYFYMSATKSYSKMGSDEMAIASATGVSGGEAHTVPMLFLSAVKPPDPLLSRLVDPHLEPSEQVEDDDCYVIGGSSLTSKKETYWISKATFLIRKYARSFEPPKGGRKIPEVPEMTDQQIEAIMKTSGTPITEEKKAQLKKVMQDASEQIKSNDLKGTSTETHAKIETSPLRFEDFDYQVPAGVKLEGSFLDAIMDRK